MNKEMVSTFYVQDKVLDFDDGLIELLMQYSKEESLQMYAIYSPLDKQDSNYLYNQAYLLLIPNHKFIFIDYGNNQEELDYYIEQICYDINTLNDQYGFVNQLGRLDSRWRKENTHSISNTAFLNRGSYDIEQLEIEFSKAAFNEYAEQRKINLLAGLAVGSINTSENINFEVPASYLDSIKQKITLYDGDQTRFLFSSTDKDKNRITIQGLAGTGKTELLLHKLRNYFNEGKKVVFTCYSQVLENSIRKRVPDFFDRMKVNTQIKWNQNLWVMRGWGSRYDSNSGVYTYICNELGLSFYNYSENNNFDDVCSMALTEMESIFGSLDNIPKLFDYILIDESQDFSESFFKLCEVVTSESIIMAGDTFQTIVGEVPEVISTDYVLNRCYRTDNRTLMFSHAVGLGLFENTKINWFKDEEWELFGYRILKKEKKDEVNLHQYTFTREPIHRIETNSVGNKNKFAEIINSSNDSLMDDIIKVIDEIRTNNSTVEARDIGIIFIQPNKSTYNFIDRLSVEINIKYKWNTIKGYETKDTEGNSLFITNDYNIKGLEFPFIICVLTNRITNNVKARNTLYMGMTRSFISSILILKNEESLAETWEKGLEQISSTNSLIVDEPDSDHIIGEKTIIQSLESDNRTLDKVCDEIFDNLFIPINKQPNLKQAVIALLGDDWTEEKVSNIIQMNWKMMTDD